MPPVVLRLPVVDVTIVDETALRTAIVIQTKGKTMTGGIQLGRFRSFLASISVFSPGRRALSTPNVLRGKFFFTSWWYYYERGWCSYDKWRCAGEKKAS